MAALDRELVYEINRLAGTLDALGNPKWTEQYAANVWAGTTDRDLLAALNVKAGLTNPLTFLGLNAVCNLIASTTNLDAVSALRSFDPPT